MHFKRMECIKFKNKIQKLFQTTKIVILFVEFIFDRLESPNQL